MYNVTKYVLASRDVSVSMNKYSWSNNDLNKIELQIFAIAKRYFRSNLGLLVSKGYEKLIILPILFFCRLDSKNELVVIITKK